MAAKKRSPKPKRGRPPASDPLIEHVHVRITASEARAVEATLVGGWTLRDIVRAGVQALLGTRKARGVQT